MSVLSNSQSIVLVADAPDCSEEDLDGSACLSDKIHTFQISELIKALKNYHPRVVWYPSPQQFIANFQVHLKDIVVPYWFAESPANHHSLIPVICEAANICYIGGNVYPKIVCNDRLLEKKLCELAGLKTPKGILVCDVNDLNSCAELNYPCVAMPIYKGTSFKSSPKSLIENYDEALDVITALLAKYKQPILVEEFIAGRDVSIALLGWHDKIRRWDAVERYMGQKRITPNDKINVYSEVKNTDLSLSLWSVRDKIPKSVFQSCKKVFRLLDDVEYMCIDGRLTEDNFIAIGLSPETYLDEKAQFCHTIAAQGLSYSQILGEIIENCLERHQTCY